MIAQRHALSPVEISTQEAYGKIAGSRNKTHGNPDFWKKEFEHYKLLLPKGKVIDVGCGAGRDALLFTAEGYEYIGMDASSEMLVRARELVPSAQFHNMSMYELYMSDNIFDGFWAAASLLHVPKTRIRRALSEIKRVVKPDGVGFIAIKEGDGEKVMNDGRFFSFYQLDEFHGILSQNGFTVLSRSRATFDYSPPDNLTVWLVYFVRIL